MTASLLRLKGVSYAYGEVAVLQDLDLEIDRGEFVGIVGPSGCGKTTLLNLLSGYVRPVSGTLETTGTVRMVYQQDGLFPWKTVTQNIEMALRSIPNPKERQRQGGDLLRMIGLSGFSDHYPHQLSGGMRQRVELARALAGDTDLLLMDEPFSALDYLTRLKMRHELARLLQERPRTVALVTHDIEEAAQLADRILVLSERPAHIVYELPLHLPRPREVTHPEVARAVHCILAEMGLESK